MKKAQGLPITFIIIAILAIIVLIAAVIIFVGGLGQTQAFDQQSALNICKSACSFESGYTQGIDKAGYSHETGYCKRVFDIKGVGTGKTCLDLTPCTVIFQDSECRITCNGTNAECV